MPKVSVLTPIYNTPTEHLKEAIESILGQTFRDFEYLILNDSPDNKELDRVVNSYKDNRIRYIKNSKNIGLEASTNRLLDESKGEYIAIFDHDDISMPQRLEKEVSYLDKHPKVGLVSGQFTIFGDQDVTSKNPIDNEDIKKMLRSESCVSHTTMMVRKLILEKYNIHYEKDFFPAASYRIITRIALVTDVHNLPGVLLKYRMDGNNTSIKHAEQRVVARKMISEEYAEGRQTQKVKDLFGFDSVEIFHNGPHTDERRYYKAKKGKDTFFVKSGSYDYENEYNITKWVFGVGPAYFVKPVQLHSGDINYLVTNWVDGVGLDEYIENNKLTTKQKESLVGDLYEIHKALWRAKIVHRDLIPRNFMVANGHLVLLDFYWAVKYDNYEEYDYIKDDIAALRLLGEDFAVGNYTWDDAYSLTKIAHYISGKDIESYNSFKEISKDIGKRVISPDISVFYNSTTKQSSKIDELYSENERLKNTNIDMLRQNTNMRKNNDSLTDKKLELEQLNKNLETRNLSLINSLSWRATKPLRFMKRTIKYLFFGN